MKRFWLIFKILFLSPVTLILVFGILGLILLSGCSSSYVSNKKSITSPDDLMKFTNIWCEKNRSTDKVIRMCGQGWSKDLSISESKAILDSKFKIADITQHTLNRSEKMKMNDSNNEIVKSYDLNADNTLTDVSVSGYKIISKKVLKEKNGYRTMILLEYNLL